MKIMLILLPRNKEIWKRNPMVSAFKCAAGVRDFADLATFLSIEVAYMSNGSRQLNGHFIELLGCSRFNTLFLCRIVLPAADDQ